MCSREDDPTQHFEPFTLAAPRDVLVSQGDDWLFECDRCGRWQLGPAYVDNGTLVPEIDTRRDRRYKVGHRHDVLMLWQPEGSA